MRRDGDGADRELERAADALNDYWNGLAKGGAGAPGDLDPTFADAVRRLHRLDQAPALPPDLRARLWEDLIAPYLADAGTRRSPARTTAATNGRAPFPLPPLAALPRWPSRRRRDSDDAPAADPAFAGRLPADPMQAAAERGLLVAPASRPATTADRGSAPPPARRLAGRPSDLPRRSAAAHLATAALLLLTLVSGFVAFGPLRPDGGERRPGGAEPTTEALLDAVVEGLPAGHARVALDRWTLRPDPTGLSIPALGGPTVIVAESGALTAAVAGVERSLVAGEHLALAGDQAIGLRAAGSGEAMALAAYVNPGFGAFYQKMRYDPVATNAVYVIHSAADGLPGGPARLLLERLTLPPGTALSSTGAAWSWVGIGSGTLGLTLEGEGLPYPWASGEEREIQASTIILPPPAPGARMTLRNAGEGPLVLYRLTLTPTGTGGPPAGAPMGGTPAP